MAPCDSSKPNGHQWIPRLVEAFPDRIESITLGKPTLEDVFIHFTGHRFWSEPSRKTSNGAGRKKEKALGATEERLSICERPGSYRLR